MKEFIRKIFNRFFLVLFSGGNFPKTKNGSFYLPENVLFDSSIGDKTKILQPYDLRKVKLGDYSYIDRNSYVANTEIGKFCSIGPNFCCGLGIHPTNGISTSPMFYSTAKQNGFSLVNKNKIQEFQKVIIGNDVFIGANVTILDGVKIGDGAVIGAGAVVTNDIPSYAIAVGVPASVAKYRFTEKQINQLLTIKWWNFPDEKLKEVENYFFEVEKFLENYLHK
jgi:acetyltransferase-like isoleucine patch superfamily enzyme